ncbi:MAG: Holliday junction branch migration protein RuvA [Firmicutes bacterium]|nr:Holliday junction branch migration protein RuvA [Bacillota bacterium]
MINFISGEIVAKNENSLVLDHNGIGFEVFVSTSTLASAGQLGEMARIFTYMNVKEDEISLYGFLTMEEKNMFLKIINVSGIGPKMALIILSGLSLSDLAVAIKNEDIKLLSTIKGLGKKTAERLALELKDKIDLIGFATSETIVEDVNVDMVDEAMEALIALGINKNEAYRLAKLNAVGAQSTEDIIRKTFQNLNV